MEIGAQMFTVRDFCKTPEALDESMKKIADIGYRYIQLSGVCAYDPVWMAGRLKEYGLCVPITHYSYNEIIHHTQETLAFHDTIGCRYIGLGSCPGGVTEENLTAMADALRPCVPAMVQGGHRLMYHNHNFEFAKTADGKTLLERLCEMLTPEECGITFDTYWGQAGGADPVEWLYRLNGRVHCAHFKDMVYNASDKAVRMAAVGEGNMNYKGILKACEDTHVAYGFVEQDNCYGEDPFDCLRRSFRYLKAQGLH